MADDGRGVPEAEHEAIFRKYGCVQADGASSGLGLTFCTLAVEAHGGRISMQSRPGEGAIFHFVLPPRPPAPAASPA